MTGISPPFAKLTVLVTRRVLPGRATPHAFVAKVVPGSAVRRESRLYADDIPKLRGFAAFAPVQAARGPMFGSAGRAGRTENLASVVTEEDLHS
jgi:hypothetical protein